MKRRKIKYIVFYCDLFEQHYSTHTNKKDAKKIYNEAKKLFPQTNIYKLNKIK